MRVVPQISVTTTETSTPFYGVKFLEVKVGNTDVLLAFSHKLNASRDTDFKTLNAGETYSFKAPKGKLFYFVFYKTASGTSTLDIVAYNGEIERQTPNAFVKTLDASAARTATVAGNAIDLLNYKNVEIEVIVSAVSGTTPTLDIKVQGSNDNSTWTDAVYVNGSTAITFTQITATGNQMRQFNFYGRYLCLYFTIEGTTPSFTFSTVITAKGR